MKSIFAELLLLFSITVGPSIVFAFVVVAGLRVGAVVIETVLRAVAVRAGLRYSHYASSRTVNVCISRYPGIS